MSSPLITFVLGTRPEIIKLAPVIREAKSRGVEFTILHTGQHYSQTLDTVFFEQLGLPEPDQNIAVGSGSQGEQTGEMLAGIDQLLMEWSPDYVVVQGDTNSTLAGSLAASKLPSALCHVEAGLRSYDRAMPEEINRVVSDHVADFLFPPTEQAAENLRNEGIRTGQITVTGNTIADAVEQHQTLACEHSNVLSELNVASEEFALLTAHRAENVDDQTLFQNILSGASRYARQSDLDILYPVHPRAEQRMDEFGLDCPEPIRTIPPLDFLDFLRLEMGAALVFTDSGGVQEETCILGTPCVTVRENTERPETVNVGSNVLVGTDPDVIVAGAEEMADRQTDWKNPFGDGRASQRILDAILQVPDNDSH